MPESGERLILLVEDNPDDQALALRALRKSDIKSTVVLARDGVEALEQLFEHELTPSLILLDLKLPRIDGFEVLKRIRENERTRLLPVVILTTSKEDRDLLDGYSLGANSYIRKPIDFKRFTEVVRQLGQYWLSTNQPPPRGG